MDLSRRQFTREFKLSGSSGSVDPRGMSFFRHREIYQSDEVLSEGGRLLCRPRPHRLDEFPVGYSLASCAPAEPASASPTGEQFDSRNDQ